MVSKAKMCNENGKALLAFPFSGNSLINSVKGTVSLFFSAIFNKAGLNPWLSTIAHTRNTPRSHQEKVTK